MRGIWGFLIFFCWKKKISRSLPVIFHTMYKTNFFFILIHSLGTFSLCGVVCLSKKEGIKKMQTPKKVGGLFFQKLKLFFNKGIFLQTNFFFQKGTLRRGNSLAICKKL